MSIRVVVFFLFRPFTIPFPNTTSMFFTIWNTSFLVYYFEELSFSTVLSKCIFILWYLCFLGKNRRCRMYTNFLDDGRYTDAVLSTQTGHAPLFPLVCPDVIPSTQTWMQTMARALRSASIHEQEMGCCFLVLTRCRLPRCRCLPPHRLPRRRLPRRRGTRSPTPGSQPPDAWLFAPAPTPMPDHHTPSTPRLSARWRPSAPKSHCSQLLPKVKNFNSTYGGIRNNQQTWKVANLFRISIPSLCSLLISSKCFEINS
jgi:hypothetical protein